MDRRRFLTASVALSSAALGGCGIGLGFEDGLWHPCGDEPLPQHLARHELVQQAWDGLDPARVWDMHVHLAGNGDSGSGASINPAMLTAWRPFEFAHTALFFNGACVPAGLRRVDEAYVERLVFLHGGLPPATRLMLMALDQHHNAQGRPVPARTVIHVPNAHAARIAQRHPRHFEWIASVHPWREDCVQALASAAAQRARAVKWVPSAMNIDPASPRCDRYYETLARLGLPLISHGGAEHPLLAADDELNNPLRLRRALDHGLRVVVAHCATQGENRDLDRGPDGPPVESFRLFARLMDEPRYEGRLFGDIAAITQTNRPVAFLRELLGRSDWHARLLNGSDYPLPGIVPLVSMRHLTDRGFIGAGQAAVLKEVRRYSPLLFDFVLKRHLRADGSGFPPSVFETRGFFEPSPPTRRIEF